MRRQWEFGPVRFALQLVVLSRLIASLVWGAQQKPDA
jgi:hypothetical protein